MGLSRILIVEDNRLVAADLSETVARMGYEVAAVAESAGSATRLARELRPDLALMDIALEGDDDGIAAAEEIRTKYRIPVVFLTAYGDERTVARTTASGAFGHLMKPVRSDELQAAISIALGRHRAAHELLQENTWLARLVASIHEGVIFADRSGVVKFLNAEGERITGWTSGEASGHRVEEIYRLSPQRGEAGDAGIAACIRTGTGSATRRMVLETREGSEVLVEEAVVPLNESGDVTGALAIFRDLSESVNLEQAQKFETIGVLAGGVAHDFNNLLAVMIGNASLALELLEDGRRERQFLEQVLKSGAKAAELTAQLLAYAGKTTLRKTAVSLAKAVSDIVELIGPTIPYRINVQIDVPENLPAIEGDASQIEQIVMNLVINASEAIGENSGMIQISGAPEERPDGSRRVVLTVQDTGPGMDVATRSKIFDPFFTTKFTGRGLGLAAVAGIVRSHDGTITVDSTPGKGSTFRVSLPASAEAVRPRSGKMDKRKFGGTETILVVDDLDTIRSFVESALESCGYKVLLAENGRAALGVLAERNDVDLVLLDLSMPVMSGPEAAPRIRALYPGIAICVMTGYNEALAGSAFDKEEMERCFLQKPFAAGALAEKVRGILDEPAQKARRLARLAEAG